MFITILSLTFIVFNLKAQHQSPLSDYWQFIAEASGIHVINSVELKAYVSDMENKIKNRSIYFQYYQITVIETLKGESVNNIKIRILLEQAFIDHVKSLPEDTELIIFAIIPSRIPEPLGLKIHY
jgi:hypothetical protein